MRNILKLNEKFLKLPAPIKTELDTSGERNWLSSPPSDPESGRGAIISDVYTPFPGIRDIAVLERRGNLLLLLLTLETLVVVLRVKGDIVTLLVTYYVFYSNSVCHPPTYTSTYTYTSYLLRGRGGLTRGRGEGNARSEF